MAIICMKKNSIKIIGNCFTILFFLSVWIGCSQKDEPGPDGITGNLRWRYPTRGDIRTKPVVAEGLVFFGGHEGFYALDAFTGDKKWQLDIRGGDPTVSDDMVYFLGWDYLYAFDVNTGEEQWKFEKYGFSSQKLAVSDGLIFLSRGGSDNKDLYVLDAKTGIEKWLFENCCYSDPVVAEGVVYFTAYNYIADSVYLYAADVRTGSELWKTDASHKFEYHPYNNANWTANYNDLAIYDGIIYAVIGGTDSDEPIDPIPSLFALDANTGKEIWNFESEFGTNTIPVVHNGLVFIGIYSSMIAIDIENGKKVWGFDADSYVRSTPVVLDNVVYFGSADNHLYALNASTGQEIWKYETNGAVFSSPTISNKIIYFGSDDNHFYALD
jgi:outer membrane protein assembly factor BamB